MDEACAATDVLMQVEGTIYQVSLETGEAGAWLGVPASSAPDQVRGICVLEGGRLAVFNGTRDPVLSIWDPSGQTWEHRGDPSWTVGSSTCIGGIGCLGHHVFVGSLVGDGLLRFDVDNGEVAGASTLEGRDVAVGQDGLVYILGYDTLWNVEVYDPRTLELIKRLAIDDPYGPAVIAADDGGRIYIADFYGGEIARYDDGVLAESQSFDAWFLDIAVAPDGTVVASGSNAELIVFNPDLGIVDVWQPASGQSFVAFGTP